MLFILELFSYSALLCGFNGDLNIHKWAAIFCPKHHEDIQWVYVISHIFQAIGCTLFLSVQCLKIKGEGKKSVL